MVNEKLTAVRNAMCYRVLLTPLLRLAIKNISSWARCTELELLSPGLAWLASARSFAGHIIEIHCGGPS